MEKPLLKSLLFGLATLLILFLLFLGISSLSGDKEENVSESNNNEREIIVDDDNENNQEQNELNSNNETEDSNNETETVDEESEEAVDNHENSNEEETNNEIEDQTNTNTNKDDTDIIEEEIVGSVVEEDMIRFALEELELNLSKDNVEGLFGNNYKQLFDDYQGEEMWRFDIGNDEDYEFDLEKNGEVDINGIYNEVLDGQIFIYWNSENVISSFIVYLRNEEGSVIEYRMFPDGTEREQLLME